MAVLDDIAALREDVDTIKRGAPAADLAAVNAAIAAVADRVTALETMLGTPQEGQA